MDWRRLTRNRWSAPGFEIHAAVVRGKAHYRSVQMGERRTYLGIADAWHTSAAKAREWCDAKQRDAGINNGRPA
ncbi:MAG: hypothetical protein IPK75_18690 [Acidobacteria bacterium]|nr:hypothetical protein [Acidobacteriota bacterium]